MPSHTDHCGCSDIRKRCPDVPRFKPPSGWRWDGTGDNGLWAVGLMSPGRYFRLMGRGDTDVWEIIEKADGGDLVTAKRITGDRQYQRSFSGDLLVYSMERIPEDGEG